MKDKEGRTSLEWDKGKEASKDKIVRESTS